MSRTAKAVVLLASTLILWAVPALSQPPPHAPAHGWRKKNDPYYVGYTGRQWERDFDISSGTCNRQEIATVVGGIAGAVLGSKIGGGSGTYVASALGTMVGGMAGRQIYENVQRNRNQNRGTVTYCDPEPVRDGAYGNQRVNDSRVTGYDVTYEYAGRTYLARTNYDPGDRIRVRVEVRAE